MKDQLIAKARAQAEMQAGQAGALGFAANRLSNAAVGCYEQNSGYLAFNRNDGVAQVRIEQHLRPELALKIESAIRDLIEADRDEVRAQQAEYLAGLQRMADVGAPPTPGAA